MELVGEPSVHIRINPGCEARRSRDGSSLAVARPGLSELPLAKWFEAYGPANPLLNEGAPLAEIRDRVLASGGDRRASAYLGQMERLRGLGLVEFPLIEDGEEVAVIAPQRESFVPSLAPRAPDAAFVFDRFACLRRDGDAWLAESPLSGARLRIADPTALERPLVRRALAAAGFLENEDRERDATEHELAHWEFHDLIFHTRSRRGWHRDPRGPQCPLIGLVDPAPARRPEWPGAAIALPRAVAADGESCAAVLERRRSEYQFDDENPISIAELGGLLDRAARSRSSFSGVAHDAAGKTARFEVAQRPYPSGGAIHELEIYPVVRLCGGLDSGLYHYDSWRHALVRIPAGDADLAPLLRHARLALGAAADPQIVLAIAARFPRVFWKYKSIGYGNILRNTGALYQTLYLAATAIGLAACAVGSADAMLFARATGLHPFVEGSVGDFVIGSKRRTA